jgi:hypothetical protein
MSLHLGTVRTERSDKLASFGSVTYHNAIGAAHRADQ